MCLALYTAGSTAPDYRRGANRIHSGSAITPISPPNQRSTSGLPVVTRSSTIRLSVSSTLVTVCGEVVLPVTQRPTGRAFHCPIARQGARVWSTGVEGFESRPTSRSSSRESPPVGMSRQPMMFTKVLWPGGSTGP